MATDTEALYEVLAIAKAAGENALECAATDCAEQELACLYEALRDILEIGYEQLFVYPEEDVSDE